MKKILLLAAVFIVVVLVVFSAKADSNAPDYITIQFFLDHVLMKWNGPTYADHYTGSVCIQKIIPLEPHTLCLWDDGTLYPTHEVWFWFPYPFKPGTYQVTSGYARAYDAQGHVISSQSFLYGGEKTYYGKYFPSILKGSANPYP